MDGGDCLLVSTAITRKFAAADHNFDGLVDLDEYAMLSLDLGSKKLFDFDIINKDSVSHLDAYEFSLLLFQYDHMIQDQLAGETGAAKWSQSKALASATLMVILGDDDMDGMLSQAEAMTAFRLTGEEFELIFKLGGRLPSDEELMQMDALKQTVIKQSMQAPHTLQLADLGKVIYTVWSALMGHTWADLEYRNGFSVEEAVRLIVKLADYNKDGSMSKAESALLALPTELFAALSPEGADGEQLTLDDILNALEHVSACEDVLIVDSLGELSVKTLYMPHGKCSILIQPSWNLPAHFPPSDGPTCPNISASLAKGSDSSLLTDSDTCTYMGMLKCADIVLSGGWGTDAVTVCDAENGASYVCENTEDAGIHASEACSATCASTYAPSYGGNTPSGPTRRRRLLQQIMSEKDKSSAKKERLASQRASSVARGRRARARTRARASPSCTERRRKSRLLPKTKGLLISTTRRSRANAPCLHTPTDTACSPNTTSTTWSRQD